MLHRIPYIDDVIEKTPFGILLAVWAASYLISTLAPLETGGAIVVGLISMVMLVAVIRAYAWKYVVPIQKEHEELLKVPNANR